MQKWTKGDGSPIIIPRKFQKFEFENEAAEQKQIRERASVQSFKIEMEIEQLRMESSIERARRSDAEMIEIINDKCTGQVREILLGYWNRDVKRNEEISHKRFLSTEKWLKEYKENFIKEYKDRSPFFKQWKTSDRHNNEKRNAPAASRNWNTQKYSRNDREVKQPPRPSYADVVRNNFQNVQGLLYQLINKLNQQNQQNQHHKP